MTVREPALWSALDEPRVPVTARWTFLYSMATFGYIAVFWGAAAVLTPQLASRVDESSKVTTFGIVSALAGLAAMVAGPLVGVLSDRTTSSRGRRHPWILIGTLGTAATLIVLSAQTTLVGLVIVVPLSSVFGVIVLTALTAALPDDVPVNQRATVSAWANGVATSVGLLIGTALVSVVVTGLIAGYLTTAVLLVVLILPFALLTRGVPLRTDQRPRTNWRQFWIDPRRHPDFAWALGGRFFFYLANGMGTLYLYYYLEDELGHSDPATGLLVLTAIYVVFASLASVPMGRISDRLHRRKKITIVSAAFQGFACMVLAVSQTWPAAIVAAVLLGCGFGVYVAVDQALVTELLPAASQRGKDLGIINVAGQVAGILAPAVAALLINHLGGYRTLYWLAAATAIISAALVQPIKSVR